MIECTDFFGYDQYTIKVESLAVSVLTLGAAVSSIRFRDKEMILGYGSADEYMQSPDQIGAVLGRYAGRIKNAAFDLNGESVSLTANDGTDQLNGGPDSFDKRHWTAEIICANRLRMVLPSKTGDNGFPGKLVCAVTYTVENNSLTIEYEGEADSDTVFGPSNRLFFTLGAQGGAACPQIALNAEACIADGALVPEENAGDFASLQDFGDTCFVLAGQKAAMAELGETGLAVMTDYPALTLDTGSKLHAPFASNAGFCLMPGFAEDSPNHPEYTSPVLRRGERFHKFAEYHFYSRSEE